MSSSANGLGNVTREFNPAVRNERNTGTIGDSLAVGDGRELGNTAARGAGTACWANASLEVSSSTFSSNRETEMGVVDGFGDVTISMSDCIVWGNTSVGAHVSAYENAVATVAYSLVEAFSILGIEPPEEA